MSEIKMSGLTTNTNYVVKSKKQFSLKFNIFFRWPLLLLTYAITLIVIVWVLVAMYLVTFNAFDSLLRENNWHQYLSTNQLLFLVLLGTLIYVPILIYLIRVMWQSSVKAYNWFNKAIKQAIITKFIAINWMEWNEEQELQFANNIKLLGLISIYLHCFVLPIALIWVVFGALTGMEATTIVFPYFITFIISFLFVSFPNWVAKTITKPITKLLAENPEEETFDV